MPGWWYFAIVGGFFLTSKHLWVILLSLYELVDAAKMAAIVLNTVQHRHYNNFDYTLAGFLEGG